ncbi:leucyl aminopeptidase [Caenispirillum bisanense]|uniref:Probable cytosol aminopeptidase n=1 Tax=Caenispirillum bisanense TaxID=414052 RepID=A0A286GGV0_9PROT|nr:leucyl aminopeptidase [Caenispirillum bisanense]SOD94757.1 leucyl aminopeptidase [Caenispirillum bisanense]
MKISFAKPAVPDAGALAVLVAQDAEPAAFLKDLDGTLNGALARARAAGRFEGKAGQTLSLLAPMGTDLDRIVLVGIGKAADVDSLGLQAAGGSAWAALADDKQGCIVIDGLETSRLDEGEAAAQVAYGALLRSYRFDKYRTTEKKDDKPKLSKLTVTSPEPGAAKKAWAPLEAVAAGIFLTRDLVSEPANVIHPESFAKECEKLADLGLKVTVLGEKDMKKLGMGALLGVGQGSARESQMVVMEWQGADDKKDAPVAFVGKGVCFDSGGISIKPAGGMEDMKWDMGGAGVVTGLMKALAGRKAKANVVGLIGLVENMPSGTAQRPGDVVTSASGQTIEVINTDAEGRLVLADVLWYAQEKHKPKAIIDLATLTGAIIISLGGEHAGLFSNDDGLSDKLAAAAKATGEKVWRMPMGDAYDKQIKSDIADMKNTGGREAGSITAAQFLKRFVKDGLPWAHIDIAGVTWSKKDSPTVPKGATAFGVRLLDRLVADEFEAK